MNKKGFASVAVALTAIAVLGVWKLLQLPTEYVLLNDCEPAGPVDKAQSRLLGSEFWRAQLTILDRRLDELDRLPNMLRGEQLKAAQLDAQVTAQIDREENKLYEASPELRPSAAQRAADELRKQADAIEHAEFMRMAIQGANQEAAHLRTCRETVSALAR